MVPAKMLETRKKRTTLKLLRSQTRKLEKKMALTMITQTQAQKPKTLVLRAKMRKYGNQQPAVNISAGADAHQGTSTLRKRRTFQKKTVNS